MGGVVVQKTEHFFSGIEKILLKPIQKLKQKFFLIYVPESFNGEYKMAPVKILKYDPAYTT
jgi:hypothetical protein